MLGRYGPTDVPTAQALGQRVQISARAFVDEASFWSVVQCPGVVNQWCCRPGHEVHSCCNDSSRTVYLTTEDVTPRLPEPVEVPVEAAKDSNRIAIVGGAIGGGLGFIILVLLGVIWCLFRSNRQLRKGAGTTTGPSSSGQEVSNVRYQPVLTTTDYSLPGKSLAFSPGSEIQGFTRPGRNNPCELSTTGIPRQNSDGAYYC